MSLVFAVARVWETDRLAIAGKLSLATPSMISLLLHNLFNASIPSDQIPEDLYEWDPDILLPYSLAPPPLTGAPEFAGKPAAPEDLDGSQAEDTSGARTEEPAEEEAERGCWVHKATRKPLGGEDGKISFTVLG